MILEIRSENFCPVARFPRYDLDHMGLGLNAEKSQNFQRVAVDVARDVGNAPLGAGDDSLERGTGKDGIERCPEAALACEDGCRQPERCTGRRQYSPCPRVFFFHLPHEAVLLLTRPCPPSEQRPLPSLSAPKGDV